VEITILAAFNPLSWHEVGFHPTAEINDTFQISITETLRNAHENLVRKEIGIGGRIMLKRILNTLNWMLWTEFI
jgi:hypothetical protein